MYKMKTKKLIINGDDFGMHASINQAIENSFEKGILTSASLVANGDAFLEITASGEMLRASSSKLRWKYVNRISNSEIGALHWARYFNRKEINLDWIKSAKCERGIGKT